MSDDFDRAVRVATGPWLDGPKFGSPEYWEQAERLFGPHLPPQYDPEACERCGDEVSGAHDRTINCDVFRCECGHAWLHQRRSP